MMVTSIQERRIVLRIGGFGVGESRHCFVSVDQAECLPIPCLLQSRKCHGTGDKSMRLELFREKLACEVKESCRILAHGRLDQRIQAQVYCIACLLRKILTRIGADYSIQTVTCNDVSDPYEWKPTKLNFVISRIIHYQVFIPDGVAWLDNEVAVVITSDEDNEVYRRSVRIGEFLKIAELIAEEDKEILPYVLKRAKRKVGKKSSSVTKTPRSQRIETLIDVFDLARSMDKSNAIDAEIVAYRKIFVGMNAPTPADEEKVSYKELVNNLFKIWTLHPFAQFEPWEHIVNGASVEGKILGVETDGTSGPLNFRAKDRLDFLAAAEANW